VRGETSTCRAACDSDRPSFLRSALSSTGSICSFVKFE
jgi:hypothetical protein